MIDHWKQFIEWIEKNPDKKKGLTEWKALAEVIDNERTNETKCLKINFENAMRLSRNWREAKDKLLKYWQSFYWWVIVEKHDGFNYFDNTFRELDYFIRHYQNSTEELVAEIKQLKSAKQQLEAEVMELKEELAIERDHSQDINDWYKRQLDGENAHKRDELWNLILELEWHGRQKDQKNKQLEETIRVSNKIIEQEYQPKENKEQGIQTELNSQRINKLEKQQKETLKTTLDLAEQLVANLKIQEEQIETKFEVLPK